MAVTVKCRLLLASESQLRPQRGVLCRPDMQNPPRTGDEVCRVAGEALDPETKDMALALPPIC